MRSFPVHFKRIGSPLTAIVLLSVLVRVVLILRGGQFYWPDEGRYYASRVIARAVSTGQVTPVFASLDDADNVLFKLIGAIPAAAELVVGQHPAIPAILFALFSVFNIWLVSRIAQRLGATADESLLTAALLAGATSCFYYTRHLVPYDPAMTFALLAIYLGVNPEGRTGTSVLCGCTAACAFLTYNGYWTLTAASLVVHVAESADVSQATRRALFSWLGLAGTIALPLGISAVLGGRLFENFVDFSRTIKQGTYDEGWRLPWEYLWHAEHLVFGIWVISALWAVLRLPAVLRSGIVRVGLIGLIFIYGMLVLFSVGLEVFVVYGRLVRQLVPFFCLLSAAALTRLRGSASLAYRAVANVAILAAAVQVLANFAQPLRQSFPAELNREAAAIRDLGQTRVLTINARHFYPSPPPVTLPSRFRVIREARHPLEFLPYQYEGYNPRQREILRNTDITMRIIIPLE
jgi:hypothetical protein